MWQTSTNIFETSVLKAKLRMRNKLRATTLTSKVTTRYITRTVFSHHFRNDIFCRIYLSFSFLSNMEASFKDDDDKGFPWAQPVRKSYLVGRPNVMRIVIESEGNSKTASLSGGPCLSEGAWWTSVICVLFPVASFVNVFLTVTVSFWTRDMLEWLQPCTVYPELQTTTPVCLAGPWSHFRSSSVAEPPQSGCGTQPKKTLGVIVQSSGRFSLLLEGRHWYPVLYFSELPLLTWCPQRLLFSIK